MPPYLLSHIQKGKGKREVNLLKKTSHSGIACLSAGTGTEEDRKEI
jgi:catabolite regulation protein CreA